MGNFRVIDLAIMLSIVAHGVLLIGWGGASSAGKQSTAKPTRMVSIQANLKPTTEPTRPEIVPSSEPLAEPEPLVRPQETGKPIPVKKINKNKIAKRSIATEASSTITQPAAPHQQPSFTSIVEAQQSYILEALEKIEKQKSYPMQARRRRISGSVTLSISVKANGLIEKLDCLHGPTSLCRAAISAAEKAQPLPALPEGTNRLVFEYQMLYKLH